ncbi:MAG: ATP-binding cassette domain-containing protein [Holdemania massiliensis]
MDECIRIANLTKTFQGKTALNQLNCVVKQGEIYGFLGPSGAGKTTTIKLLTGQLKPQSGELTVLGKPVVPGRNDLYSQIGVLTDNSGFYEKMTVRENLKLFARISKHPILGFSRCLNSWGWLNTRIRRRRSFPAA